MAEDKSKADIKADIASKEAETTTVKDAKKAKTAAKAPVKGKPKAEPKSVKEAGTKTEIADMQSDIDKEVDSGTAAVSKVAKAGKRSAKAIKEAEEKQAKEERKAEAKEEAAEEESKPKVPQKPARPRIERQGKKFREAAKLVDKEKKYSLKDAIDLATKTSTTKFDATVELHVRLGVDPRQADQNIRDMVALPHGTGKEIRVAVFADGDDVADAKKAGADIAGSEEFLQQLDKEVINFDVLIATPAMMSKLGKHARLLGPKGLMPNPKSGTVTTDVTKAVKDAKAGRVEYRVDSTGIVHLGMGKVSFGSSKLQENARAVLNSIKGNKPSSIKGSYVKSAFVTTSMGPSIELDPSEV